LKVMTLNRRKQHPYASRVVRTEQLSPHMRRLVLHSEDFTEFTLSDQTDSYVKIVFLAEGLDYSKPVDLAAIRASAPPDQQPQLRTYTVRAFDQSALELSLDVFVHPDNGSSLGPGAELAMNAQVDDEVLLLGPGGGYAPTEDATWHLFVGDESALPSIAVALERQSNTSNTFAFIEVHDDSEQVPIDTEATVRWIFRGERPVGEALVEAVRRFDFPDIRPDAFVHGEAAFIKEMRNLLLNERRITRELLSISGYWRSGATDEQWRAIKAQWALNA